MNKDTWFLMHEGPFTMGVDLLGIVDGRPAVAFLCQNCGAIFVERFPG